MFRAAFESSMTRSLAPRQLLVVSLSGLALAAAGCGEKQVQAVRPIPAAPVTVARIAVKTIPIEIQSVGTVEAFSSIVVRSMVAGQLIQVHFREGQDVRKGDVLFTVDPRPYRSALTQAEANLARERAQVAQIQANLLRDQAEADFAKAQAERYVRLVDEGIGSREQAEQFTAQARARAEAVRAGEAALDTAKASVRASEAAVQSAKVQLSFCTITSPIDGRTGSLAVNEGNIIRSNDTVLVTINQVTPVFVTFAVPENYLSEIRRFMAQRSLSVTARRRGGDRESETGTLQFIDNLVDQTTGTIRLKAVFSNRERRLWPGEFVDASMRLSALENVAVAPSRAVQTGQQGQYLFVVKEDQTVELRPVRTGPTHGGETVIEQGVAPGETVVTDGQLRLAPGVRVDIKQPS
jgi:membrane fusion protein, multidrug efflux system